MRLSNEASIKFVTVWKFAHFPANWADMRPCPRVEKGQLIGETLRLIGAVTAADVSQALDKQAEIGRATKFCFKLGALMRVLGLITFGECIQAMAIQHGLPSTDVDEVVERLAKLEGMAAR